MTKQHLDYLKKNGRGRESLVSVAKLIIVLEHMTNSVAKVWTKKTNEINKEKYLSVLLTKESNSGINKGFRVIDNSMYTY